MEINSFMQHEKETISEAWEKYKGLFRKCPNHERLRWLQVNQFYNGLNISSQVIVETSAEISFSKKSDIEAYEILEDMASNNR